MISGMVVCDVTRDLVVISRWILHENEVERFIVEMGWEQWVVSG